MASLIMNAQRQKLLRQLNLYGYALLEPDTRSDPTEVLAQIVKTHDARIVEGFPVVLANVLARGGEAFDVGKVERRLGRSQDRKLFHDLLGISVQLFRLCNVSELEYPFLKKFSTQKRFYELLSQNSVFDVSGVRLHSERLRRTFMNYYERDVLESRNRERTALHEQFRTEYLLSLLLSPKQKDLLMKKLRGEKMTKTEREYFSRTVRKKLMALADPDLHHMAQKALQ